MDNRRESLIRTMKALAVACCLVVGALPLGQVPNFVGRCGQKLCHCPVEQDKTSDSLPQKPVEPQKFMTLSTTSISGAEETIALQGAFSAFVTPEIPAVPITASERQIDLDLQYSTARPPGVAADITTPPPRLTA